MFIPTPPALKKPMLQGLLDKKTSLSRVSS